jgi:predicted outer membrane repeat protein
LIDTTVSDNSAGSYGGGISTAGTANLGGSTISGNSAVSNGGGIDANTLTLTNCTVDGNVAATGDGGGFFAVTANLTDDTTVDGNWAGGSGGGIAVEDSDTVNGTATLTNCTVSDNFAAGEGGGLFCNGGGSGFSATLTNTTVSDNRTAGAGGGIAAEAATLAYSTVSHNHAGTEGGGIDAITATLTGSTVNGNSSASDGGGIHAETANLTNSTVSGNSSGRLGGGILADGGQLLFDTIAENSASQGGGVEQVDSDTPMIVNNTIIALNLVTFGGAGPDVHGSFNSLGTNLIGIYDSTVASGFNPVIFDQIGSLADPLLPGLSPFGNNGGPTETYSLLAGSKAIGTGVNLSLATLGLAAAPTDTTLTVSNAEPFAVGMLLRLDNEVVLVTAVDDDNNTLTVQRGALGTTPAAHLVGANLYIGTDQRGVPRPVHGAVDIGAYELGSIGNGTTNKNL